MPEKDAGRESLVRLLKNEADEAPPIRLELAPIPSPPPRLPAFVSWEATNRSAYRISGASAISGDDVCTARPTSGRRREKKKLYDGWNQKFERVLPGYSSFASTSGYFFARLRFPSPKLQVGDSSFFLSLFFPFDFPHIPWWPRSSVVAFGSVAFMNEWKLASPHPFCSSSSRSLIYFGRK